MALVTNKPYEGTTRILTRQTPLDKCKMLGRGNPTFFAFRTKCTYCTFRPICQLDCPSDSVCFPGGPDLRYDIKAAASRPNFHFNAAAAAAREDGVWTKQQQQRQGKTECGRSSSSRIE